MEKISYINPDDLLKDDYKNSTAFIYNKDNTIVTGKYNHMRIIYDYYDYYNDVLKAPDNKSGYFILNGIRKLDNYLIGRAANITNSSIPIIQLVLNKINPLKIVSFWNPNINPDILKKCLFKLMELNIIDKDYYISTIKNGTTLIQDYIGGNISDNKYDSEKLEKDYEMHLLSGEAKKNALLNRGSLPKPRDERYPPGVKSWAPTSEVYNLNFKDWINLNEIGTSASCVASFAMPLFSSPMKRKKKKLGEQFQALNNPMGYPGGINPNQTIPVQNKEVIPSSDEISIKQYFGGNIQIFSKLLEIYNKTKDEKIKGVLLKSLNGHDYDMLKLCQNNKECRNENL